MGKDAVANQMAKEAARTLARATRARELAESKLQLAKDELQHALNVEADARAKANARITYAETFK